MEWRKNFGTDDLLDWEVPEVMRKYWPGGVHGCDKEGHPILYQLCKDFDTKGIVAQSETYILCILCIAS